MFIFYKIINQIDGILEKIPAHVSGIIRNISIFVLVLMGFLAIYIGYRSGKQASQIPGDPLVKATNDALRHRLKEQGNKAGDHLVIDGNPMIHLDSQAYERKERVESASYQPTIDKQTLTSPQVRGIDKALGTSKADLSLVPLDLEPRRVESYTKDAREEGKKRAISPEPLHPKLSGQDIRGKEDVILESRRVKKKKIDHTRPFEPGGDIRDLEVGPIDTSKDVGRPKKKEPAKSLLGGSREPQPMEPIFRDTKP